MLRQTKEGKQTQNFEESIKKQIQDAENKLQQTGLKRKAIVREREMKLS